MAVEGPRSQPVEPPQDISEHGSGDGDLSHLESDITAAAHDLHSNLDRLLA